MTILLLLSRIKKVKFTYFSTNKIQEIVYVLMGIVEKNFKWGKGKDYSSSNKYSEVSITRISRALEINLTYIFLVIYLKYNLNLLQRANKRI